MTKLDDLRNRFTLGKITHAKPAPPLPLAASLWAVGPSPTGHHIRVIWRERGWGVEHYSGLICRPSDCLDWRNFSGRTTSSYDTLASAILAAQTLTNRALISGYSHYETKEVRDASQS